MSTSQKGDFVIESPNENQLRLKNKWGKGQSEYFTVVINNQENWNLFNGNWGNQDAKKMLGEWTGKITNGKNVIKMYIENKYGQGSGVVSIVKPKSVSVTQGSVKISNVYEGETIKTCSKNNEGIVFPKDGGKPYGSKVAVLLSLTNKLNLKLQVEEDNSHRGCFKKMRDGTTDIVGSQKDKDGWSGITHMFSFFNCESWSKTKDRCPSLPGRDGYLYYSISKKSKFASIVDKFKSAVLPNKDYLAIFKTNYTSTAQHDNWGVKPKPVKIVNVYEYEGEIEGETIKTCLTHSVSKKGFSFSNFPSDGSKPFGRYIELNLRLTNKLNLELMIIKGKDNEECLSKMRSGEIDIMTHVGDSDGKRDYMELIPYLECKTMNWKCKGNDYLNYGISKKSKYVSRISEFKSALLSNDEYIKIYKTKYTSADCNDWRSGSKDSNFNKLMCTGSCSKCDLSNVDFNSKNMGGKILNDANLSGANLSNVALSGSNLSNANLQGANLSGSILSGADFSGANLSGADLSRADLTDVDLSDIRFQEANLQSANLRDANLSGADFSGADLRGATLGEANLNGANLQGANLSPAWLSGAVLIGANLSDADLSGADLSVTNLTGANLNGANLQGANLGSANLSNANLTGANLTNAMLRNADLSGANLSDANLSGANVSKTNLTGSNLTNAILTGIVEKFDLKLIIDDKAKSTNSYFMDK